jgi:hypothetical protein
MKKVILIILLVLLPISAIAGDSLLVAIRSAKNNIVKVTSVEDSVWNQWANAGYQACLTDGFGHLKHDYIFVKPYAFPDSHAYYGLPSDCYVVVGATIVTTDDEHDLELILPGQGYALGTERTGIIEFAIVEDDSIRFSPNPTKEDTVLLHYYSTDSTLDDSSTMNIPSAYTSIMADYIVSQYFTRMGNAAESDRLMVRFSFQLDKKTHLRRLTRAGSIIQTKPVGK